MTALFTDEMVRRATAGRHRRDVTHIVCDCDEDTAKCGADVSNELVAPPKASEKDCPECALLNQVPCPVCGG